MNIARMISTGAARLGFVGVLGALYTCACLQVLSRLTGLYVDSLVMLACGALACAVFLLDRVKPADRFEDPADFAAHPARHEFVWRYRRPLRGLVIVLAVGATALLLVQALLLAFLPIMALGGVLIYGSLPRRPRPKDVLIIKNIAVAGSITALCVVLLAAGRFAGDLLTRAMAVAAIVVFLQILLDAILCDIDDLNADRAFGTSTLPVKRGASTTWIIAAALQFVVVAIWMRSAGMTNQPVRYFVTMCLAMAITFGLLYLVRPRALRDLVDGRLPIVVLLGDLVLRVPDNSVG